MNKEEIEDILEELHLVRPEILKPKAKKLFEVIMSIADERDELKKQLEEADLELQLLDMITDENIKYKNQQKEFIEYLETATIDPQSMLHYRNCLLEILKEVE